MLWRSGRVLIMTSQPAASTSRPRRRPPAARRLCPSRGSRVLLDLERAARGARACATWIGVHACRLSSRSRSRRGAAREDHQARGRRSGVSAAAIGGDAPLHWARSRVLTSQHRAGSPPRSYSSVQPRVDEFATGSNLRNSRRRGLFGRHCGRHDVRHHHAGIDSRSCDPVRSSARRPSFRPRLPAVWAPLVVVLLAFVSRRGQRFLDRVSSRSPGDRDARHATSLPRPRRAPHRLLDGLPAAAVDDVRNRDGAAVRAISWRPSSR